jgi:glutaredoxin
VLIVGVSLAVSIGRAQELAKDQKSSEAAYVVVLKNGQRIQARTKPVSAFGKVRFMEAGGTNRVLAAPNVDIEKTRAANASVQARSSGGTLSVGGGMADFKPSKDGGAAKTPAKSVKVYSATWCPYCTKLKKFLAENGISASITEVDKLPEAAQQKAHADMKRLTGKVSFPTVVIGDSAIAGFSPQWILKTLEN